jgi:hypothetical protein
MKPRDAAFAFLPLPPASSLGVEAACWESLHAAYATFMRTTSTYTTQSVGILATLTERTWAAYAIPCRRRGGVA